MAADDLSFSASCVPLTRAALFLDFDGTLVPIADTPRQVEVDEACLALIDEARTRLDGRLAVLTGRTIGDIDRLLRRSVDCVAGVHGLEVRTAKRGLVQTLPGHGLERAGSVLHAYAKAHRGLLVEDKGQAIAIHYRRAPEAAEAVLELVERLAAVTELEVQRGAMVAELKTPGLDKGQALRGFMAAAPFEDAIPIVLGDDLTDEAAFVEAQVLGGFGVLVGPDRPSSARGRLPEGPAGVRDWLGRSLDRGAFHLSEVGCPG